MTATINKHRQRPPKPPMRNGWLHDALSAGAGDSREYQDLRGAVLKARGDRARAFALVARELGCRPHLLPLRVVKVLDQLLAEVTPR